MTTARAAALYAVLTVAFTWPLAARLHLMEAGDSAYFAWAMAWAQDALLRDPASLPHANALHPLRYALFLDEPIVATSILALPVRLLTDDATVTLNVTRLALFLLTALGVRALALEAGASPLGAFAAGALFSFAPFRVTAVGHISLLGTQFLPWALVYALRWSKSGAARDSLLAGAFFGLSAWACGYHAVLAVAILPIPLVLWARSVPSKITALAGCAAVLVFLLPLRELHGRALSQIEYERRADESIYFSTPLQGFLATHSTNRVWGAATEAFRTETESSLFPGVVLLALAAGGTLGLRRTDATRRAAGVGFAALSAVAFLVCLGPEIRAFDATIAPGPAALLRSFDLFRMIRVFARAAAFLYLGLVVLAAFGLDRIASPARRAVVVGAALLEILCAPLRVESESRSIDSREAADPAYAWLREAPRSVVAELPMLPNDGLFQRPRFDDSVYLLRSVGHRQTLVNGFAGVEPPALTRLRARLRAFPATDALDALQEAGVRYVLVHLRGYGPNRREAIERDLPLATDRLEIRAAFGDDRLIELKRRP